MEKPEIIYSTTVDNLNEGDLFQIPLLTATMRNMRFLSTNYSGTLIEGEKRDGINDPWKRFKYAIANKVRVDVVTAFELDGPAVELVDGVEVPAKRKRGRPRKTRMILSKLKGVGSEFTVKDVVESNNLKGYEAQNLVRSALNNGQIKVVREVTGGRGKPRKVYRLS